MTAAQKHQDLSDKIEDKLGRLVDGVRELKSGKIKFHLATCIGDPPGTVHFVEVDPLTGIVQFFDMQPSPGGFRLRPVLLGSSPFGLMDIFILTLQWVRNGS